MSASEEPTVVPHESYAKLFARFLRFGLLAWGGAVAQIGMIRQELVEEERWITPTRFNRVLALYQVLPGPEAPERCVYFGMLARFAGMKPAVAALIARAVHRIGGHALHHDGWLWVIALASAVVQLLGFAYGALSVVLVLYLVQLGLDEVQVGLLLAPSLLAGGIKIVYDLTLYPPFRQGKLVGKFKAA